MRRSTNMPNKVTHIDWHSQDSNPGSLAPELLLLATMPKFLFFPNTHIYGERILYHYQINMPLLASEIFISQRRVCLAWSCCRDLSHQACWFHCMVSGFSKMDPLCLEHLFPSWALEQSVQTPRSQPAPPQPYACIVIWT